MQYIVLDLEWNQPWPGSPSSHKVLPVPIHGEIIQIGAVRLLDNQSIADEFMTLVRPKYYRKLNKRVSSLTGIKEARLRAEGIPFPEAITRFLAWCGEEECTFLAWGFDDLTLMRDNLLLFGMDTSWISRWYNLQMIFNAQTDGSTSQKAISTAMQMSGIEPTRPAHDALGDAFHTAQVAAKLELARGCREYAQALKNHENGFHGAQPEGCIERKVFHGYKDKDSVLKDMGGNENRCPICEKAMKAGKWYPQPGKRFMTMSACPEHGNFLIRIRVSEETDGMLRISRLIYKGDSEAAKSYENISKKKHTQFRPGRRTSSIKKDTKKPRA